MRALGLMSGTSMDGIDIALIETDGREHIQLGPSASYPYSEADRALLRAAVSDALAMTARDMRPGRLSAAEAAVTERHAEATERFLAVQGLDRGTIDVVGFHGQTVLHRPDARLTVQIGDAAVLARGLGLPIVSDMRANDVAAGGQGAPLVPAFHRALVERDGLRGPVAVINIGGVANVTWVDAGRDPIACDTGPGNALLDDLMLERTGLAYDEDGVVAAAGRADADALAELLSHSYFSAPPPKSLDRNAFSRTPVAALSTEDAAATLVAFTAETIARALAMLPPPRRAVVCGGGGRNPTLMRALAERLPCPTTTADGLGWSTEAMEAQAFAYLAVRSRAGLPITFPGTTGVPAPLTGGRLNLP